MRFYIESAFASVFVAYLIYLNDLKTAALLSGAVLVAEAIAHGKPEI